MSHEGPPTTKPEKKYSEMTTGEIEQ